MSGPTDDQLNDPAKLQAYYEEQFAGNEFINSSEADWKKNNAAGIITEKCAIIYFDARAALQTGGRKEEGVREALTRAGYGNVDAAVEQVRAAQSTYDAATPGKLKTIGSALLSGGESAVGAGSGAAELQNMLGLYDKWLSSAGCPNSAELDGMLDEKYTEARRESLGKEFTADLDALGVNSKKASLACARDLVSYKKKLEEMMETFWSNIKRPDIGAFNGYNSDSLRGVVPVPPPATFTEPGALIDLGGPLIDLGANNSVDAIITDYLNPPAPSYVNESAPAPPAGPRAKPELPGSDIIAEYATKLPNWSVYMPEDFSLIEAGASTAYKFRWDFMLMAEAARKALKEPEWYRDLSPTPTGAEAGAMPTIYMSLIVGIHNVIEFELLAKLPTQAQADAFQAGSDGSGSMLYTLAQSITRMIENPSSLQPPTGEAETFESVIGYAKSATNNITNSQLKNWLSNDALSSLNSIINGILEAAKCIKDEKEDLDRQQDAIKDAVSAAAGDKLDKDEADDIANQARQAVEDFDIDDVGFANITDKKLFKEQCFLLAFAAKIAAYKNKTLDYAIGTTPSHPGGVHKRLPYNNLAEYEIPQTPFASKGDYNACLQMSGNPFGFINKLTQSPNYKDFLDVTHDQLSALQPRIRLFKVVYNDNSVNNQTGEFVNSRKEREVEIAFDSAFTQAQLEDIFLDSKARSAGIGLKSFEFTYDGNNPFSYKKSIKAKLVLHAASFQEFFVDRSGKYRDYEGTNLKVGGTDNYRYIDLALKTFSSYSKLDTVSKQYAKLRDENSNLAKLNFRLKAVVGWSMPTGDIPGLSAEQKKRLRTSLSNSFVTLNLTPTVHNFNFQQDGSVSLEIDYLAYIDDFFDDRGFNVFADPTGIVGWQRELRKMQMKRLRSVCKSAEGIREINEDYAKKVQKEINDSLSSLITSLIQNKKIYYINLDYAKIQNFVASGPFENYENYVIKHSNGDIILSDDTKDEVQAKVINDALEAYQAQREEYNNTTGADEQEPPNLGAALFAASPQSNELSFFYLSDLIDIVLENIQREQITLVEQYENKANKELYTFPSATALAAGATATQAPEGSEKDKIPIIDWNQRRLELEKFAKNLKRMRIVLGPVELVHHKKQADGNISEFVNFGDIPISVKYFMEWVSGKVLSKNEIFYPLPVFLNQLMNNLVTKFLNNNECFYFDIKQKIRVNQSAITAFSPPEYQGRDELTNLLISTNVASKAKLMKKFNYPGSPTRLNMDDSAVLHHRGLNADSSISNAEALRPILNVSGRPNEESINYPVLNNEINYMVFFAGLVSKPTEYPANREQNENDGIFHYLLGRDRGLIKEINLQKTTSKGLAEVRFEQDGYDGLKQLRVVYDLDVKSYANVNTFPGTYIYVPAAGFDPGMKTNVITTTDSQGNSIPLRMEELGIGGYYMIIRSTHKFGIGEASSEISAKWVAGLASDYPIAEGENSDEGEEGCGSIIATRKQNMGSS